MNHRDRKLLDLAHDAPCFLQLGVPGCGTNPSVPCHSDMLRHGRGSHYKSHDIFAVPGCPACHAAFTRANLGREGYEMAWRMAWEAWMLWAWQNNRIRVA